MREIIKNNYEVKFKSNISQIHSISLEEEHTLVDNNLKGNFILSGDYKAMGLSLSLTDYKYEIPYTYTVSDKIIEDTLNVEIEDFSYDIDRDTLNIAIEYSVKYDENHEEEIKELDRIFDEVIDLREEVKEMVPEPVEELEEEMRLKPKELLKPEIIEESEKKIPMSEDNIEIKDEYITYHICIVNESDTLESILDRYKISIDVLKEYNDFDELKIGMKLIIPYQDE